MPEHEESDRTGVKRRTILKGLAAAPLIPRAWISSGVGGGRPDIQTPSQPPQASPAADAMTEVLRLRYGGHLSREQLEEIKTSLAAKLRNSERLRSIKLHNSDEPEFVFRA